MRILLIAPPFYQFIGFYNRYFPLGLAYLAAVLKERGHEVSVYDSDTNINPDKMNFAVLEQSYPKYLKAVADEAHPVFEGIKQKLNKFNPELIGISAWTTYVASSMKTAEICKKWNASVPVVMGGPHISIKGEELLRICADVDVLVRGEGEETLPELATLLQTKKFIPDELKKVNGIAFRAPEGITTTPDREFARNLDAMPFPARDLLVHKDAYDCEDMGLLMTTRGCPFACTYCATTIWGRKVRSRSIANIIEEVKSVAARYGTKQFAFKDDSFTINRARTLAFCEALIKEHLNINWECNARVDSLDAELLARMRKAGCNSIKVGIETGSERILKLVNKNITLEQCRQAAKALRDSGIHWTAYFMIGLPTETKEDMNKTLSFMKELRPDFASLSVYEPFPGTKLYDIGVEMGLVCPERTREDYFTISPKYYYVKNVMHRIDTMPEEEFVRVEAEIKCEFRRYNLSFTRLARRALSRTGVYLNRPSILFSDIKKFLAYVS
ncbi:MAG TPA: hypothetical protein DER10_03575 [Elusimicrobia bacterium]|nr:MAG: hypothetical protein A2X33_04250 [Elusimicrobia bacterium GWA2_51_34]HAF96479.1 hypothetical protein [Elusimicrobiota bacterium]HCE97558.1 hypothetical protein [Elusimicrobiota bacterium]